MPQKPTVPPSLVDVAQIDGPTCAASADISISHFLELVRLKQAPQPVIRRPRCTRWLLSDIRSWLIERAVSQSAAVAGEVTAKAKKASAAARAKRATATAVSQ